MLQTYIYLFFISYSLYDIYLYFLLLLGSLACKPCLNQPLISAAQIPEVAFRVKTNKVLIFAQTRTSQMTPDMV